MTVRYRMDLKGLSEYLERIAQAGADVDAAAAAAVEAGGDVVFESMLEKVPVLTGNLKDNLERTPAQQDGNFVFIDVGLSKNAGDVTARYGNTQEYGSASMEAQPYIRPSFDENKSQVRAAEKKALEEMGIL